MSGEAFKAKLEKLEALRRGAASESLDDDLRKALSQFEAASALASSREPEALEVVKQFWLTNISPDLRRAVVFSLGDSPLPEAADFLLSIIDDRRDGLAAAAVEALGSSRFKDTAREPASRAVEKLRDPQLKIAFAKAFA